MHLVSRVCDSYCAESLPCDSRENQSYVVQGDKLHENLNIIRSECFNYDVRRTTTLLVRVCPYVVRAVRYIHCGGAFGKSKLIGRTTGPILRAPFKRPFNALTPN
jgi:hypothetical protein